MPSRLPRLASTYPTALSLKCSMISSLGTCLANIVSSLQMHQLLPAQQALAKHKNHYQGQTTCQYHGRAWSDASEFPLSYPNCHIPCLQLVVVGLFLLIDQPATRCQTHSIWHHDIHFQMPRVSVAQT